MKTYRLTDEEFNKLMDASKPVPYMVFDGIEPRSPHDNAMDVWRTVAARVGCDVDSIGSAGTGDNHDFNARPLRCRLTTKLTDSREKP